MHHLVLTIPLAFVKDNKCCHLSPADILCHHTYLIESSLCVGGGEHGEREKALFNPGFTDLTTASNHFLIGRRSNHRERETAYEQHPDALLVPQNHLSAIITFCLAVAVSFTRCNTWNRGAIFSFSVQVKQMVALHEWLVQKKCTSVSSVDGPNLPSCFKHDLCPAEEVLRNPALLVQWCLSKELYNSVSTVDSSCVNCRRGSNYLQQSVLAFNQLFSSSLGGMWRSSGCVCVGVFLTYHYIYDAHQLISPV